MDINIKYKEIDKIAKSAEIVSKALDRFARRGNVFSIVNDTVSAIDSLYKEDSKQIESVEIYNPTMDIKMRVFDNCIRQDILEIKAQARLDKSELSQYINLLQQINDQMEG